jgi:hypothetical protein
VVLSEVGFKATPSSALDLKRLSVTMGSVFFFVFVHKFFALIVLLQVFDTNYNGYATDEVFFVSVYTWIQDKLKDFSSLSLTTNLGALLTNTKAER